MEPLEVDETSEQNPGKRQRDSPRPGLSLTSEAELEAIQPDATVEKLRKMCTSRRLPSKGSKIELLQVLRDAHRSRSLSHRDLLAGST